MHQDRSSRNHRQRIVLLSAIAQCDNNRRTMELRHLATFVAVAEEGSFTRASSRLHVVQSAVSAGVRTLERELGAALFDRTTHRVELTDAGVALLPEARATLVAARAAREAVDAVRGGLRGTVTLGIMQTGAAGAIDIAALLAAFRADHPDVELRARQGHSADMAAQVRDGGLDFAFLALPRRRAGGLHLTPLGQEPMLLAVHERHPLARRTDVELTALGDEVFADGPETWGTRMTVDRAFAAAGAERHVTVEVNDTQTLVDFVRHGLAAAFLPPSLVRGAPGIALVPVRHHAPVFETYLAEPTTRRQSAAAAALLTLAKHKASSDRSASTRARRPRVRGAR
jgi:DNA-binding transcriptional LysR family regulator